jgi:hypothetical protein
MSSLEMALPTGVKVTFNPPAIVSRDCPWCPKRIVADDLTVTLEIPGYRKGTVHLLCFYDVCAKQPAGTATWDSLNGDKA